MLLQDSRSIHRSALVIDGHADTPQRFLDDGWSLADPLQGGMLNLETARRGNLAAIFFALWVDPAEHPAGTHHARAMALGQAVLAEVKQNPNNLHLCLGAEDICFARRTGRLGVLLSVEGGHAIEDSLQKLRDFYQLGVRSMTLTWNNSNAWADSCTEARPHGGLTVFGREVIAEMNRLGMLIDISHASDDTFWQALEHSTAPIVATHSCARGLVDSPRNLTDEQLRGLAAAGGVCMVNFFPAFLSNAWRLAWRALEPERRALHHAAAKPYRSVGKPVPYAVSHCVDRECAARIPPVALSTLVDHIDHVASVAGIDHVGLGSDFDGIPALPDGLHSAADLPKITDALSLRGYTTEELHQILGGNFLRIFAALNP